MRNSSAFAQVMERWNQLPRSRQIALGGIVAGAVVVLYFVFIASASPNMVVAYQGLALEDSSQIADQLEKEGVPYEILGGGSQIAVPAKRVAEVRIKIAAAGLGATGGTVGFEIFDKTNFGATDKDKAINFVRALQGELTRSINTVEGIESSRVLLSMPEDALFKEDQEEPKASVVLKLRGNTELDKEQIRAITNLVTSSVEGLKTAGVTIMDDRAAVLFDGSAYDSPFAAGASATQLDLQRQYEKELQSSAREMLSTVVGPVRSNVTVRAAMNFDAVETLQEEFAETPTLRSSSTTSETFNGTNLTTGQVPGTGANGGADIAAQTGANGDSTYTRTESTTNNDISRTTTTTVKAPGAIERLSVSVVLDESVTQQQEQAIRGAVAAAVGLDQTRGDLLNVVRLPFDVSVTDALVVPAPNGMQQYLSYVKLLIPVLAVALAFVLIMLLLRSLSKRQLAMPQPYLATALAGAGGQLMPGDLLHVPALESPGIVQNVDAAEERVMRLADSNPRAVADVVQTWMREDDH